MLVLKKLQIRQTDGQKEEKSKKRRAKPDRHDPADNTNDIIMSDVNYRQTDRDLYAWY